MGISQGALRSSVFLSKLGREVEAVLFDMDGVLADSVPLHVNAWNYALQEYKLPLLDRAAYLTALGRTNLDMIEKFLGRYGIHLALGYRKEIVAVKEHRFRELVKGDVQTLPGVIDWLEFLQQKYIPCAVASSGEMANIVVVLDALHLADYFLSILSGALLPASKPDPMLFLLAAASLGANANKCLVVEDAPAGIQAAKAASMLCCGLSTTCSPEHLGQADILLQNLADVDPASLFADARPVP